MTTHSTTEIQHVRLSLHGMHLALSELISAIKEQPDNTVLYREKDIKSSGIWGYVLAIDEAYRKQAEAGLFTNGFPEVPARYPIKSFMPARFYGMLPLHEGKVGVSLQTQDEAVHRFVISQIDAERIGRTDASGVVSIQTDHQEGRTHPDRYHLKE